MAQHVRDKQFILVMFVSCKVVNVFTVVLIASERLLAVWDLEESAAVMMFHFYLNVNVELRTHLHFMHKSALSKISACF